MWSSRSDLYIWKTKGLDPALFETVDLAIQEFYENFHHQPCLSMEQEPAVGLRLGSVPLLRPLSYLELTLV